MAKSYVELVGKLIQINQYPNSRNTLDIILDINTSSNKDKGKELERFTVLLYKPCNFKNESLIVGETIKIKGNVCCNLFRNCRYRRRLMIIPTEIEILEGGSK